MQWKTINFLTFASDCLLQKCKMVPEALAYIIHTVILVYFLLDFFPVCIFQNSCNHVVLIIYPDFFKPSITNVTLVYNNKKIWKQGKYVPYSVTHSTLKVLVAKIYYLFNNLHITGFLDSTFLLCYYKGNKYYKALFLYIKILRGF